MNLPYKILFSSAGRRVELMNCFRRAAGHLGVPVHVSACDASPKLSAACYQADAWFSVPRCGDPAFIPALLNLCASEAIQLLVPTIDPELEILAAHRAQFQAVGTEIAVSSPDIVRLARDKLATHEFLLSIGLPTPRTLLLTELLHDTQRIRFPVIVKPRDGSSSVGIEVYATSAQLQNATPKEQSYIVQERWLGREYTVNLFFDRQQLRCAIPHLRIETRAGEVSKAVTERVPQLSALASKLGEALRGRAFGSLCFQAIITPGGEAALLEINARFGGGYPLADHAGASFAQWLLEIVLGRECTAHDHWHEHVQMLRYDASVFTDTRPAA